MICIYVGFFNLLEVAAYIAYSYVHMYLVCTYVYMVILILIVQVW